MATRITEKDVWKAADEVLQAGERPTIERIRSRLGRGSPNTVNEHLNTWYTQLSSRIRDLESFTPASSIPEPVGQAARHFWEVAQSVAREESAAALTDERAALSEEQQRLANLASDLQAREKSFESRSAALAEALALSRGQLEAAGSRATALEEAFRGLQDDLNQARRLELDLRGELAASRALIEEERSQADERRHLFDERLEQASRRAALEIDQARERAKQADAELQGLQDELRSVRSELADTSHRLMKADSEAETARRHAAEALRIQTDLSAQLEAQKESMTGLEHALAESHRFLRVKDEEHGLLLKQLVATIGSATKPQRKRTTSSRSA